MEISDKLREARKKRGLTQKELADKLSVSQANYSQYETGKRIPKIHTLKKIADILGIPITTFYPISMDIYDTEHSVLIESDNANLDYDEQLHFRLSEYQKAILNTYIKQQITKCLEQLNLAGQQKALEQLELLLKIPDYKKDSGDITDKN